MSVKISKELLFPFVIYNKPFQYDDNIIVYPVTMENVIIFQFLSQSITVRKNSTFHNKKIIKMTYFDFLIYALGNKELESQYKIKDLSEYFLHAIQLLQLCCKDATIRLNPNTAQLFINDELITPQIFDDLRRIIIIQNDIDFDIDEFINYETEQKLMDAQKKANKNGDKVNIEDYIDSLVIAMNTTEERIMNMTIRKFYRYLKRYRLYEDYTIAKTGECSGMVKYKEPIKHWMISIDQDDKYSSLKADENALKNKISNANG